MEWNAPVFVDDDETNLPADPKEACNDGDPIQLMHERIVAELQGGEFVWRG